MITNNGNVLYFISKGGTGSGDLNEGYVRAIYSTLQLAFSSNTTVALTANTGCPVDNIQGVPWIKGL